MVVPIGDIIGVAYGLVIPSIGRGVYDAVAIGGPDKVPVEGHVHIVPVVYIDKTGIVAVGGTVVIDMHAPDPSDHSVVVMDIHVPDLGDPPVIVVIDGYVLHLDHRPIFIVLYIGVVVVARVEGDAHISDLGPDPYIYSIVHVQVELTVGIDREGHPVLHKAE